MAINCVPSMFSLLKDQYLQFFRWCYSQNRPSYTVVTNIPNMSGALRNKGLFLVLKKKNIVLKIIHDTLKNGKADFMKGRLL